MYGIIYSADYDFQIVWIVKRPPTHDVLDCTWDIANKMAEDGTLEKSGIVHYDVVAFDNDVEMNEWILEQVAESRKDKDIENAKYSNH